MTSIHPSLLASSLLTVGGSTGSDEVGVIPQGCGSKDWYIHFMLRHDANYNSPRAADTSLRDLMVAVTVNDSSLSGTLDSNLLPLHCYSTGPVSFGTVNFTSNLYQNTSELMYLFKNFEVSGNYWITNKSVESGYYGKARGAFAISPFLGVGSKIPTSISSEDLTTLMVLLDNPAQVRAVIVGDCTAAFTALGRGLVGIRAWLVNHFGVVPSATSIGLDCSIPYIYSTHEDMPSPTELYVLDSATKRAKIESAALSMQVSLMWTAILYDFGYFDSTPLGEDNHPVCWSWGKELSWDGKSSRIPFNHPWVVLLLGLSRQYSTDASVSARGKVLELVDPPLLRNISTGLSCLKDVTPFRGLLEEMPSLTKSFSIQLYRRLSKRGYVSFPTASEFPKRTDISRVFHRVYTTYQSQNKLKDFIDVFGLLWENNLWQAVVHKTDLVSIYSFLCRTSATPLSKLMLTHIGEDNPLEIKVNGHLDRVDKTGTRLAFADHVNTTEVALKAVMAGAPTGVSMILHDSQSNQEVGTTDLVEFFEEIRVACEKRMYKQLQECPYSILQLVPASRLSRSWCVKTWLDKVKVDLGGAGTVPMKVLLSYYKAYRSNTVRSLLEKAIVLLRGKILLDPSLHSKGSSVRNPSEKTLDALCTMHIVDYLEEILKEKPDPN